MLNIRIFVYLSLIILSTVTFTFAQNNEVQFPDTTAGKRTAAYLKAFNSGDEKQMSAFFSENVSPASLQQRPIEARLDLYRRLLKEHQELKPIQIVEAQLGRVIVLVKNKSGKMINATFFYDPAPPNFFGGFRLDDASGETQAPTTNLPASLTKAQFNNLLEEYLNKLAAEDKFSGVVLVAGKDQPIFQKSVGLASKEFNASNRIDTKFNLGSVTKFITQIAIGQLVAAGKLSYEDKVGKILPDYPNKDVADKVAIKHLLTMKSGMGDIFGEKYLAMSKSNLRNLKDYFPLFVAEPLQFEPGTSQLYSSAGYIVLGAIIEKLSGQSYYDYAQKNIFQPAGMKSTDFYSTDEAIPNLAQGYTNVEVGLVFANAVSSEKKLRRNNFLLIPARGSSAGGVYSTAEDLLKLSLALQSGKIKTYDMASPTGQSPKPVNTSAAGSTPGVGAVFEVDVAKSYTIVILTNYELSDAAVVQKYIKDLLPRLSE